MTEKKHFLGIIKPVREGFMTNPTEKENKVMQKHFEYLKGLLAEGKLVLAGPVLNEKNPFGLYIFQCTTKEEAENLFKNDPSILSGVQKIKEFEPFKLSLYNPPDK
ncbi:MAG TPA: YciI family protein [candidate division Zixibacteria bacterium]|nr:YciI family protein [candidate division Zixibacteria bacterium]